MSSSSVLDFSCPRCSLPTADEFYGPCESCRSQLRATMGREAVAVEAAAYEPKMNVVPNQVAMKD